MANLLDKGSQLLKRHGQRVDVTLARGNDVSAARAMLGETLYDQENDAGSVVTTRSQDFIFEVADYQFGGDGPTEPEQGDIIATVEGHSEVRHQVMSIAGAPPWRYTDQTHQRIRVHTRIVERVQI